MPVSNCAKCNRIFQKYYDDYCPDCAKARAADIQAINDWILSQKKPLLANLKDETGIELEDFYIYLDEGRIHCFQRIWTNCEICNADIPIKTKKHVCSRCQKKLKCKPFEDIEERTPLSDVEKHKEESQKSLEEKKKKYFGFYSKRDS
jgi:Zn finger protein HypA/HybF involved in hydrogenase expression